MQRCSHSLSTASALRSIFFPTSNQTCVSIFLTPCYATDAHLQSSSIRRRTYASNTPSYARYERPGSSGKPLGGGGGGGGSSSGGPPRQKSAAAATAEALALRKYGAQKTRRPINDEIPSRHVRLVGKPGPKHGEGSDVVTRESVMRALDLQTECLVMVGVDGGGGGDGGAGTPVCRIMTRKEYFESEQQKSKQEAARKKPNKPARQLEVNWTIDQNDIGHRLKKALELLNKGSKLEIIISPKKRAAPATPDKCAALVRHVKETVLGGGHKEWKPMAGKVGATTMLYFEPRSATLAKGSAPKQVPDDETTASEGEVSN